MSVFILTSSARREPFFRFLAMVELQNSADVEIFVYVFHMHTSPIFEVTVQKIQFCRKLVR